MGQYVKFKMNSDLNEFTQVHLRFTLVKDHGDVSGSEGNEITLNLQHILVNL